MRRTFGGIALLCYLALCGACSGYRTTLMPRVTVMEEYTDNVDLVGENPRSDFITSVTPGLTVATSSPAREASLSYEPTLRYYAETGTRLASLHAASLNALNRFSRHSRFEFMDTFNYTDDPMAERDLTFTRAGEPEPPPDTTRRTDREPYYTNTINARFHHDLARDSFFFLNYTNSILRNEDPTVENNTRNEPSAGLTYWFNSRYGIETRARVTFADFDLATDPYNEYQVSSRFMRRFTRNFDAFVQYTHTVFDSMGDTEDYRVYEGTVGVDYHPSPTTFFTLSAGYFYRDDPRDPQDGYVVRADMAKRFSRGSVRVTGGTGYRLTYGGAENLGFTEFSEIAVSGYYDFSRRLAGEGLASYGIDTYNDAAGREDTSTTFEAGLRYIWTPWLSTRVRFSHRIVDSNAPGESYDENRVTFSISIVPPHPIVWER